MDTDRSRKTILDLLDNRILPLVQKPGRYIGGEVNSIYKDLDKVDVRVALVFPDVYEVGMSNLGLKILYEEINSKENFYAERAFSPWIDMEGLMRRHNIPAFTLETHTPLIEFDFVGFSLQYELCYTNVLNMLNLSGIPLRTEERLKSKYPFIIGGGSIAYIPETLAPFIDLFIIGDGEEMFVKLLEFYNDYGKSVSKEEFLEKTAEKFDCVYVPSLYTVSHDNKNRLSKIEPRKAGIREKIKKNVFNNLNDNYMPLKMPVPLIEIVHDRASVEIMRGCPRNCRFCQAGVLYKPVRKRDINKVFSNAVSCIKNTGYGELGLLSLSSTDYNGIDKLAEMFLEKWNDRRVSISLPSMRIDSFSLDLVDRISKVKKTGITLAPEAGSQKLLEAINKGYKPGEVIDIAEDAYKLGYKLIKLYFMIGLPGENYSDLDELINLLYRISKIGFSQVNVSISTLVPKAHTAFQWSGMLSLEEIKERQGYIKKNIKKNRIRLKFHNPYMSLLEGVFSRGDRRLGEVIFDAWRQGARFDQWEECFKYDIWEKAFRNCGINPEQYLKGWDYNDSLPWDHLDISVEKEYLEEESKKAYNILKCVNS